MDKFPEPITIAGNFKENDYTLEIVSGTVVLADILGSALVEGKRMFAQVAVMIYGDSIKEFKLPVSNATMPQWPDYMMMSTGYLFWPRVGETFTLTPKFPGPKLDYKVFSDNGPVVGSYHGTDTALSFVPENDEELNVSNVPIPSKPIYFVSELPDGSIYSYTINIHRSRYASLSLALGFVVFFAAMLLTLLSILIYRHKRRNLRLAAKAF
jgi:hypothetical protein